MKKVMATLMVMGLAVSMLAGCGTKETASTEAKTAETDAAEAAGDETYSIGICQLVQHDALDAATQGFKDALTEKLGDKVSFDEQNASGDSANCATIVNQFVSNDVDLILAKLPLPFRQQQQRQIRFQFSVHQSRIMRQHWKSMTGQALQERIFPVLLIWLLLRNRQRC